MDCKEIQPVNLKGNQSWIFIGRTDAEAEAPIFWPPDVKNWLVGKDPDDGKDWRQEEKGITEVEMVEWYHWLNGHEFDWTPGVGDAQGDLACCSPWGCKKSDMIERLNWTELNWTDGDENQNRDIFLGTWKYSICWKYSISVGYIGFWISKNYTEVWIPQCTRTTSQKLRTENLDCLQCVENNHPGI